MAEHEHKDKGEEDKGDIRKTPEYRKFRKLLKQVIKAPPLRTIKRETTHSET